MARTTSRSTSPPNQPNRRNRRNQPAPQSPGSPRNRTPQPLPRRRRTFGDFVKAFLAFVALLGLVVGVPGALAVVHRVAVAERGAESGVAPAGDHGHDLPAHPDRRRLARLGPVHRLCPRRGEGRALRRRVPGRVPGAGRRVRFSPGSSSPLCSSSAPPPPASPRGCRSSGSPGREPEADRRRPPSRPPALFAQQQEQAATTAAALAQQAAHAPAHAGSNAKQHGDTKYYRIQPPEGRHHDSLWEIARAPPG